MTEKPIVVDITQKFAEGFGVDRIAAIFQEEVQNSQTVGIKNDQGKLRWDLLPLRPIQQAVEVLTVQVAEYGEDNWQRIERPEDRFYAALMRHITAWRLGEQLDPKTKLPHLAHALVNVVFLLWHTQKC